MKKKIADSKAIETQKIFRNTSKTNYWNVAHVPRKWNE